MGNLHQKIKEIPDFEGMEVAAAGKDGVTMVAAIEEVEAAVKNHTGSVLISGINEADTYSKSHER